MPALGFLVETRDRRIAFAGDQNGENPAFRHTREVDLVALGGAGDEHRQHVAALNDGQLLISQNGNVWLTTDFI